MIAVRRDFPEPRPIWNNFLERTGRLSLIPRYLSLKRRLRSGMTGPERLLWWKLRARQFLGLKFRRQHGIGPYIVDFYCAERSLVIEIDGDTHAEPNQIQKDVLRDRYLQSLGLHVVRYRNDDILKNLDGVLYDLEKRVSEKKRPPLAPPYEGGE